ncbi:glycosyltransferase family 4 protein [Halobacillus naozhouensis]|uniref:Glycosyltransferase family 4 protein n=1 Tax=Halobacillus naozhouensis TaxID=554880 RepID=A0ABY8IUN9_9BACI|nr:glycosyltransferase family 4 protein [Halobacillus naozhouensis]WFT73815.1 glycosyltransferase family 4 protein [Halobacillus naozhouensis]
MSKIKILQVGPLPPPIGGMSVFLNNLRKFKSSRYELSFFNIFPKKDRKLNKVFFNIFILIKFLWEMKKQKPEIIHIHTAAYRAFTKSMFFVKLAKWRQKKVIIHIHSGMFVEFYNKSSKKRQQRINHTLQQCDQIICLSETWKKLFINTFSVDEENYTVLPNAIFIEEFNEVEPLPPNEGKTILFVGKLIKIKGVLDIIEMAKRLKDHSEIKFLIMGDGPLKHVLEEAIDTHNLHMKTLGTLSGKQKAEQFERANLFLLPSYFEALGLSNLEGMAAGHVVLSTNVGAIPDVITDDQEGYLFEPGNIQAFVEKILELDMTVMQRISEHNKEQAKQYDFSILNKNLEQIYDVFLKNRN